MATIFNVPVDMPPEYYPQIGEIVSRSALLEFQVRYMIWRILGLGNPEGRVLTVGMDAKVLLGILQNLAKHRAKNQKTKKLIKALSSSATLCLKKRNEVAHGVWGHPIGNSAEWRFQKMFEAHERIMPRAVRKDPDELKQTAKEFRRLNVNAETLIDRLTAEHAPSPNK